MMTNKKQIKQVLNSIRKDLIVFKNFPLLNMDVKSGLDISIEQIERYIRNINELDFFKSQAKSEEE